MSNGPQSQLKHSKNLRTIAVQKALGIGDGKIRPVPPAAKENTQSGPHQESDFQRMLKAAQKGDAEAQVSIGNAYKSGEDQDDEQAVYWWHKAAKQGHAGAQRVLGHLYYEGKCVNQDYEQAAQWYRKAAEQGEIPAQLNLAKCYDEHPDLFKEDSSLWLQKAGAGLVTLNEKEDEHHERKKINFTPEDFSYLDKQREQGNPVAKVILAQLHQAGHGVPQDTRRTYALLKEAAGQDDLLAQYCLGLAGMKGWGWGTRINPKRARKYFNQVLNVLEQREMFSYLKTAEKTRQDKSRDYPQDIKLWLGLVAQTKLRLLDLEESKKNLENLIATLAHEFRGSFAGIRYNITHDNDAKDTEESINTMRGMLNVFGVISTGADELQQQLMQDMNGDRSLSDTLVQTLSLAVVQLLTVSSQSTIAQHYLAYAGRTRQQVAVSRKQWQDECIDLREKLQTEWEKGFVALPPVLENIQAWMHEHMGPIEVSGFASAPVRFSRYGATESVLLIVMTEMLVNAVKYYSSDTREPIVLEWRHEQAAYRFSCDNPSCRDERLIGKGSYQGHKFLSMIAEKLGGQFTAQPYENHYSAIFTLPVRLLSREEI